MIFMKNLNLLWNLWTLSYEKLFSFTPSIFYGLYRLWRDTLFFLTSLEGMHNVKECKSRSYKQKLSWTVRSKHCFTTFNTVLWSSASCWHLTILGLCVAVLYILPLIKAFMQIFAKWRKFKFHKQKFLFVFFVVRIFTVRIL